MNTYKLQSNPMISAAGMLYAAEKSPMREHIRHVLAKTYSIKREIIDGLATGKIPYRIVGENEDEVEFDYDGEAKA